MITVTTTSIVFYFVFVVTVGITFSRRNKNTSDYFRGGGIMPWWMAGVSAWMASFSAWTFTGAAGKIYSEGPYVLLPVLLVASCRLSDPAVLHLLPVPADADGDADGGDSHRVTARRRSNSSHGSGCRSCCCSAAWA